MKNKLHLFYIDIVFFLKKIITNYKKICANIIIFYAVIMPFIYFPTYFFCIFIFDNYHRPKVIFMYVISSIIFILYIIGKIFERNLKKLHLKSIEIPFVFMFIWVVASSLVSPYQDAVYFGRIHRCEGMWSLLSYLTLFYVAYKTFTKEDIEEYIKVLVLSSVLISVCGILQYYNIEILPENCFRSSTYKNVSLTFGNRNFTGSYAASMLSMAMIQYVRTNKRIYILPAVLQFALLIAAMTRGTWIGAFVGISITIILFWKFFKENIKQLLIICMCFMVIFAIMSLDKTVLNRTASIKNEISKIASDSEEDKNTLGSYRGIIYKLTFKLLPDYVLIGSGPDTLDRVFDQKTMQQVTKQDKIVDKTHCEYLQMWVTIGFPFLIAYLYLIIIVLRRRIKRRIDCSDGLTVLLFCTTLSYLVQATFNISVVGVAPLFWIALGIEE